MCKRFLCLLLCILLPCTALGETYKRDADWPATFEYASWSAGEVPFGYTASAEEAAAFSALLEDWMAELCALLPGAKAPMMYLLAHSDIGASVARGGKAFVLSGDDARSQLRSVVEATFPTWQRWAAEGVTALLLDDSADPAAVQSFLAETPDSRVTSLLPCYFDDAWTTNAEQLAARTLARRVAEDCLDAGDTMAFGTCSTAEQVETALAELGTKAEVSGYFSGKTITWSQTSSDAWQMTAGNGIYKLMILPGHIENAQDLYWLVHEQMVTMERCAPLLMAVEGYNEKVGDPYRPITYEIEPLIARGGHEVGGTGNAEARRVQLTYQSAVAHETCHVPVPHELLDDVWVTEGMAEYLSHVVVYGDLVRGNDWAYFTPNEAFERTWLEPFRQMYAKLGGDASSMWTLDPRLMMDASSVMSWVNADYAADYLNQPFNTWYTTTADETYHKEFGFDLTYDQATSFLAWLIDQRGFEHVVRYAIGEESESEALGFPVGKLRQKWELWLKNEAGL